MKDEGTAAEAVATVTAATTVAGAATAEAATTSVDTAMWLDPWCAWTWALAQKWEQDSVAAADGSGSGNEPERNQAR